GSPLRVTSSGPPGNSGWHPRAFPVCPCSRWGLPCRPRHRGRGGLLLHPFTLTACSPQGADGGLLSVALSRGSLRVGVTHHRSRWSPDFPRPRCCGDAAARPAGPPPVYVPRRPPNTPGAVPSPHRPEVRRIRTGVGWLRLSETGQRSSATWMISSSSSLLASLSMSSPTSISVKP